MTERDHVSCVSAFSEHHGSVVRVTMLLDGRARDVRMEPHVAAALAADITRVLGSSLLYNAGLESGARIAEEWSDDSVPKRIREVKIGRKL